MIRIHVSSRLYWKVGHQAITEWLNMTYGTTDYLVLWNIPGSARPPQPKYA